MWKLNRPARAKLGEQRVFVAARHGCHDSAHQHLTERGESQMRELAAAVRRVATKRGLTVEILSSAEPCALQGARIVADELDINVRLVMPHVCFWADGSHVGDFAVATKIVEALFRDGVLLLVVSNVLMSHRLTRFLAAKEAFDAKHSEIGHGQGLMLAKKGVSVIPRPR